LHFFNFVSFRFIKYSFLFLLERKRVNLFVSFNLQSNRLVLKTVASEHQIDLLAVGASKSNGVVPSVSPPRTTCALPRQRRFSRAAPRAFARNDNGLIGAGRFIAGRVTDFRSHSARYRPISDDAGSRQNKDGGNRNCGNHTDGQFFLGCTAG
jgi:hypothetical protein